MTDAEFLSPTTSSQREALAEAVASYQQAITPEVARYLIGRGLDRQVASNARLGVVADPFPGHERFRNFLSIPYLRYDGEPVGIRFRCLSDHNHRESGHGKYMSISGDPARTYNVRSIHTAGDTIHVAEGEFDALILCKVGLPAIAIPGANSWSGRHRRMLAGFKRVYVWSDPDEAGAEMLNKISRSLRSARGVRLRDGDVSDSYIRGGADALLSLIKEEDRA